MGLLDGLGEGPAPVAGGIAQMGAGALQAMDQKRRQDQQAAMQERQMSLQEQEAARRQEAWNLQKQDFAAKEDAETELGTLLASGKMGPGLSSIYKASKADVNGDGVPDSQQTGSGKKAAKGQTWGNMVLNGQPETLARGQSMIADGQSALQQLQDHLKNVAARNPKAAAKLQADPRFQDAVQRAQFMVSHGQELQGQHYAAQADRSITNGMLALAAGEFEDARGFFGAIGLNLPKISGASQDPKTGLYRIKFANGSGVSMPLEEALTLADPRIDSKEKAAVLKEIIQQNYQLAGKETTANAGIKEAQIRAGAATDDQKNLGTLRSLDQKIAALPPGSPEATALMQQREAFTQMAGGAPKTGAGSGKAGKAPARWSADTERQAKEYEQIMATSQDPDEIERAKDGLAALRAGILPKFKQSDMTSVSKIMGRQSIPAGIQQPGMAPVAPAVKSAAAPAPRKDAARVTRADLQAAVDSPRTNPQQKTAARQMLKQMGNRQEAYFDTRLKLVE